MGLLDRDFSFSSGERVVALSYDAIPPDHLARYEFACEVLSQAEGPLIGADVFCGVGYGTHLLAQNLPCFILGIDGSGESINRASQTYVDFNVLFSQKFFPFTLPENNFDFIVSMESIEHVEDSEAFFRMLVAALKPHGDLIVSAPNSDVVDLKKNPYPWHYRHFTVEEFITFGEKYNLELISWRGAGCTVINPAGKVVAGNYYSPLSGALKEGFVGDTQTYNIKKKGGDV